MPVCPNAPADKKAFGVAVGNELAKSHGKKKHYKPEEVKRATRRLDYPIDWDCWAMCIFVSVEDFTAYHQATGEVCDYAAMKASMLSAITDGASDSWFNMDMSWLDWPEIDMSSIFDFDIF